MKVSTPFQHWGTSISLYAFAIMISFRLMRSAQISFDTLNGM
nr:MAG TPA: hypothetical protein [Caudoviricetes sp.]